jgi:hypothetical protein
MNIIKWKLNFVSCNFGRKSNLWLQIALPLRGRAILISVQIALHSVQIPLLIARLAHVIIYLLYAWQNPFFKIQLHFVKTFNSFEIGRLLRSDIVYFHFPFLGTEIFLRELTLSNTLSSNPKSSRSVDLQFSHKLQFYLH